MSIGLICTDCVDALNRLYPPYSYIRNNFLNAINVARNLKKCKIRNDVRIFFLNFFLMICGHSDEKIAKLVLSRTDMHVCECRKTTVIINGSEI